MPVTAHQVGSRYDRIDRDAQDTSVWTTTYGYSCPDGSFEPYFVSQFNGVPSHFRVASFAHPLYPNFLAIYVYRWDFATGQWVYLGGDVNDGMRNAWVEGSLPQAGGIVRVLARAEENGSPTGLTVDLDHYGPQH
jgi:hypothetical protein